MDVDVHNGCLNVMPGSKARGRPASVPMKRGDILFMHNLCLHCGNMNMSDRLRWSVDFRYFPAHDLEELDAEQMRILKSINHYWDKEGRPSFRAVSGSGRQTSYEEWIDRAR